MKKLLVLSLFALGSSLFTICEAQCLDCANGRPKALDIARMKLHRISSTADSLPQAYLQQNVCGLNYTTATVLTETRTSTIGCAVGTGFPTSVALTGLPLSACTTVLKAYLYMGVSYTEATPPPATVTITNPNATITTLPATMQGDGLPVCWAETGTATYRVDVTSLVSGNGNYTINVSGFANANWEIDGVTLLVVYKDPTASYSGSIQINDGDICNTAGEDSANQKGFTVCAATSNASAFAMLGDMQCDVSGGVNTETFNGSTVTFPNLFWNYCAVPTSLTAGQNSVAYSTYTNDNNGDCYFLGVTGLYWQNTTCTTCTPVITTMTLTATSTPASCGNNGTASVTVAGNAGPPVYNWEPGGQTNATATGLAPGTYTVSVSDGSTCASDTVTVGYSGMALSMSSVNENCSSLGSATVTASGGTAPYTYLWSPGGQTTASISGLIAGIYEVSVMDNTGCTLTDTAYISNNSSLGVSISSAPAYLCPATGGLVLATPSGGTPPYTYVWSPGGQTTALVTGLSAGIYSVHVTDSNGCSAYATDSVALLASAITDSVTTTPTYCPSLLGTATANPSGGTAPYTYLWSPGGQTTATVTGLSYGYYTVVITDANGCSTTTNNVSVGGSSPTTYAYATPPSITPGDSVYLYAWCNIPATYSWSPSSSVTNPNSPSTYAHPTVTTSYICTITTACGTYYDTLTITVNCFTLTITNTPTPCGYDSATATANVSGGSPPYTYLWKPSGQTTATATGLSAGGYYVQVTDSAGCSVTNYTSVSSSAVSFMITASPDTILVGDSATLTAICNSTTATYTWSNGATTSSIVVNPTTTTTYSVFIITPCGADSVDITVYVNLCANPFNEPICIVTVDTATDQAEVIWGRTNSPPQTGYGYYDIYKDSTLGYESTHTQPLNVLTEFIDPNSNPSAGPVSYVLSTVDSCGMSSLSSPNTTIFLLDSTGVNENILYWTPYVGFTPVYYYIYRGSNLGTLVKIDSVSSSTFTYTDLFPPVNCVYLIEVVNPSGPCIPTAHMVGGNDGNAVSMSNPVKVKSVTGIPNINNSISNITIYPNPGNGQFTLSYYMVAGGTVRINIVDELGQIVYDNIEGKSAGATTEQINLESLASGIYSLRLQTSTGIIVKKLVVMKK